MIAATATFLAADATGFADPVAVAAAAAVSAAASAAAAVLKTAVAASAAAEGNDRAGHSTTAHHSGRNGVCAPCVQLPLGQLSGQLF